MKRDMELVRTILIAMEEEPSGAGPLNPEIPGYDRDTISHHVLIMGTGGLIDYSPEPYKGDGKTRRAGALNIRWEGYEFLDKVRDQTTWDKVKQQLAAGGRTLGNVSLGVITRLASKIIANQVGLSD